MCTFPTASSATAWSSPSSRETRCLLLRLLTNTGEPTARPCSPPARTLTPGHVYQLLPSPPLPHPCHVYQLLPSPPLPRPCHVYRTRLMPLPPSHPLSFSASSPLLEPCSVSLADQRFSPGTSSPPCDLLQLTLKSACFPPKRKLLRHAARSGFSA